MNASEETEEAYPLDWPVTWPRRAAAQRTSSAYKVTFVQARDALLVELRRMGAGRVVLSSNVRLGRGGLALGDYKEPTDPGVAVYWNDAKKVRHVVACDVWRTVRENMRAVCLAIEALRALRRSGAGQVIDRAFDGLALPERAGTANDPPWWEVLRVSSTAQPDQIKSAYRELVRVHHPDRGGSDDDWNRLNRAYAAALPTNGELRA